MSEFKVGDLVRLRTDRPDTERGVVRALSGERAYVGWDGGACWYQTTDLVLVTDGPEAPSPDYEQHAINHAAEVPIRTECNVPSHEEMAAECTRLRAEVSELLRENAVMRRRIEKLERKR